MLTKLGKYEITGELGSGAMGVVYRAEDPRLGRPVALKTTNAEVASNPNLLKRFYREAQAAAKLAHPNIVTIYEIDEANGVPFIAMEFLEGENLQKIISDRRELPILRKLQIIIDTCKGLDYAHQHGVVHRDVKPGNIVVLNNNQVKIVDFGIARVGVSSMTRTGVVLGTVMYMSPEQVQGQTVDARSDIFSLGVVLYELLTYQTPFPGEDVPSILIKIMNEPPEPITKYIPQCPPLVEQIVQRALAKDREQRYQTAEDVAFDLQRIADSLKRETVDVYLQQGQRSLQNGDFTLAKESLQKVLEIDSSQQLAKSLLAQVRESIQSRQRAQKIEQVLHQANEAIQTEQYEEAIGLLEEALRLDPTHAQAQKDKQLAVEQRDRAEKVRRQMERAEKFAAEADFQRAKTELEGVLGIDPGNVSAKTMMGWVLKELTEQDRLRQVRQYLEGARTRLTEKNFTKSLEVLDKARELDPNNIEVEALTRMVRSSEEKEERRKLLVKRVAEIEEKLSRNKLDLAIACAEQALREFPDDPQVIRLHTQVLRRTEVHKKRSYVDEQLQAAREFLQKNQYSAAQAVLEGASQIVPDDTRLTSFLKTVLEAKEQAALEASQRDAIREANEQIRTQNLTAAIETMERSLARSGQSTELMDLLQFTRERLAEQQRQEQIHAVLSRAQNCLRDEQYEEAMQVLGRSQNELKSSEIDALLATARDRQKAFEGRREEIIASALKLLETGDVAKAVALFEAAPNVYFKSENFQRVYSQSRRSLDRANFLRTAAKQIEKCLAEEDTSSAESLLKQALESYPDEPTLHALQKRLREEKFRLRREQRVKLLDEAQVALGRMEYAQAAKLLSSVSWESGDLPELAAQAKSILEETKRREREHQVLLRAQSYLRDEQYDEALQVLTSARDELKSSEIDMLLATARERREAFERRGEEIIARALQMLQSGEVVEAVKLFEEAPKVYFKKGNFQRVYLQCRQNLDRAKFVLTAVEQIKKCLAEEDITSAESLLEQALKQYSDDSALLALQKRLREEEFRLRREERVKLLEEAQMAVGRMEYGHAAELLTSVTWESPDLPELAAQAKSLLEEARRRECDQTIPQLVPIPAKRREPRGVSKHAPAPGPTPAKKPRIARAAILGVAAVALASVGTWYVRGRNAPGYIQLTAAPWGQVASVSNAKGERLNITGETPLQVALPPGHYVIELRNAQASCKVEAAVERGSVSAYSCVFPEGKIDDLVQKVLSAY
ncbi:MAG: protein kinase domain-containing protein [Candidatus Acidiferrales bacterium]